MHEATRLRKKADEIEYLASNLNREDRQSEIAALEAKAKELRMLQGEYERLLSEYEMDDESNIKQSKKELLDCIHNLMGCFDNPVARKRDNTDMSNAAREIGRAILESNGRSMYYNPDNEKSAG